MIPKIDPEKMHKNVEGVQRFAESMQLFLVKGKNPILISDQCTGCKACKIACPVGAISESKQKIGENFYWKKK